MSKDRFKLTTLSCFVGIFVQAIVTNLTAILFIPMMELYSLSYVHLGILAGINFTTQVAADIIFSGLIDRIGFRRLTLPCTVVAFAGLVLFGMTPYIFPHAIYTGVVISTIIFSFASGLLEVLLSPIVDAIPNAHKGPAMSLMHSFYAWGQAATIIITTLFLYFAGGRFWNVIALLWAAVPLTAFAMFSFAPFPPNTPVQSGRVSVRKQFFSPAYIAAIFAIMFGGASEVVMNQWASTFAERALELPKLTGDLLGMCGFAVMLGIGRLVYGLSGSKLNLKRIYAFVRVGFDRLLCHSFARAVARRIADGMRRLRAGRQSAVARNAGDDKREVPGRGRVAVRDSRRSGRYRRVGGVGADRRRR